MAKKVGELTIVTDVTEYGCQFKGDADDLIVIDCDDDLGMAQTYAAVMEGSTVVTRRILVSDWEPHK